MLVLHAALDRDDLLLWGEQSIADSAPGAAGGIHPYAADHEALHALVAQMSSVDLAQGAAIDWAVGWLPSRGRSPVPSQRLLGDAPASRASVRLKRWRIPVMRIPTPHVTGLLAACDARRPAQGVVVDPSVRVLAKASRQAAALVLRQEYLPDVRREGTVEGPIYTARWSAMPSPSALDALAGLTRQLPHASCALVLDEGLDVGKPPEPLVVAHERLLERFVDGVVDELVRSSLVSEQVDLQARRKGSLHDRWLVGLTSADPVIAAPRATLEQFTDDVRAWQQRVRRAATSPFRLCFRLEEPKDTIEEDERSSWYLRFLLQSRNEPSFIVEVGQAWKPTGADAATLKRLAFHAGEHLLAPLGEAARLCEPVEESLRDRAPAGRELDTAGAHRFLAETAPLLEQAGFGVFIPAWWQGRRGRFQLNLRAKVRTKLTGGRQALSSLNLDTIVGYDWRLAIGDAELSSKELETLAAQKLPLVRVRGKWVELDPAELAAALDYLERLDRTREGKRRAQLTDEMSEEGALSATVGELVGMSVGGGSTIEGLAVGGVSAGGDIADLLAGLAHNEPPSEPEVPAGLRATLRPYQARGYAWLAYMAQLGLGACLADDMGLGKTVQTLAAIQLAWEQAPPDSRAPSLIVCPTSVVTNWLRECEMFTPELPVLVHHGTERHRGNDLTAAVTDEAIVITSYALLARDVGDLARVAWRLVVLDEAQNIKNPGTRHARAARALVAPARYALTGTPVENNVGDLWSIMEFLNPGLLGSQVDFRRKYMLPIQTNSFPEASDRLRRLTSPFLLRRVKTDRSVIADLPDKFEAKVHCTLTTEQVTLYEAVVRDAERIIRGDAPAGIERRGMILATLSKLKQVCNHPAQFLGDNSRIADRSGKLARVEEMLEEVLELGERALVFTQFVGMGELLQRQLQGALGREVLFLHGGSSRRRRDEIVSRFQSDSRDAPPVLVLSLKAGGSGLNLTAANHVFHFDRWWNPATEQQASDRAFRIGQTRDVQVHAFVCAGTVEEQIDRMIEQKRGMAARVVGSGEQWITELADDELLDLIRLRQDTVLQPGRLDDLGKEWRARR